MSVTVCDTLCVQVDLPVFELFVCPLLIALRYPVLIIIPQRISTLPQPQPDFAVNLREKVYQLLLQKGGVRASGV